MHWHRLWVALGNVCLRGGDSLGQRAEQSASALPSAMLQRGCSSSLKSLLSIREEYPNPNPTITLIP